MEANIYVKLPPKCIEFPQHSVVYFSEMILMSPLHCETQATGESVFYCANNKTESVGSISIIGASMQVKTLVISICT